jgi:hypothetical protein
MRMMRWALLLAVVLAVMAPRVPAAPAPSPAATPDPSIKYGQGALKIYPAGRRVVTLRVEIARTAEARSQGLMYRMSLPDDAGMLFVFESDSTWAFWMKNTLIPLSIGFIDSKWRLLKILDMAVEPDPARPQQFYAPGERYRYALEVNQGYFARKGIEAGARIELIVK